MSLCQEFKRGRRRGKSSRDRERDREKGRERKLTLLQCEEIDKIIMVSRINKLRSQLRTL